MGDQEKYTGTGKKGDPYRLAEEPDDRIKVLAGESVGRNDLSVPGILQIVSWVVAIVTTIATIAMLGLGETVLQEISAAGIGGAGYLLAIFLSIQAGNSARRKEFEQQIAIMTTGKR